MVKLVQLLCPQRHCICATAYEDDSTSFDEAQAMLKAMVGPGGPLQARCMLCGSTTLHFEEGVTAFKTLSEAAPWLEATALANAEARKILDESGQTWNKARWQ